MAAPNPPLIPDLRGGVNDADSPFALGETQVVSALNVDFRAGQIGTKRGGMTPFTLTGSIFQRDRPRFLTQDSGGFNGAAGGSITVSAISAPADGTTNTNHVLLVWTVCSVAAADVTAITLGAAPLTQITQVQNGASGRLELWALASPALAGGTLTVTISAATDCAIIADRWADIDNGIGVTNSATTAGTGTAQAEVFIAATINPTTVFVSGMCAGAAVTAGVTTGLLEDAQKDQTGAHLHVLSTLGQTIQTSTVFNISGAGNWAAARAVLTGRLTVLNADTKILAIWRFQPQNNFINDELWAMDNWGRLDRYILSTGVWAGGIGTVNGAIGPFTSATNDAHGVSLHGKMFVSPGQAGGLGADRCLVWDPLTIGGARLRWSGFSTPAVPTPANTGGGAVTGIRYYRIRWTEQQSGVTVRRSEPSTSVSFTPSGAGAAVRVTRPTEGTYSGIGGTFIEGQTHWELEASVDNVLFYRIATTVLATTTFDDTLSNTGAGTYTAFTLSESIGQYVPLPAVRHLVVDDDRLLGFGSVFLQSALDSRVFWTVLRRADGVGNDERVPAQTAQSTNYFDLDALSGGKITMALPGTIGIVYAFKDERTYKLVRTGNPKKAYDSATESPTRGCRNRQACVGHDEQGQPAVYFVDKSVGVCRVGMQGVEDLMQTRRPPNGIVNRITCSSMFAGGTLLFYPKQWLIWVWVALDSGSTPNYGFAYNIRNRSWTDITGPFATVTGGVMFPTSTSDTNLHPIVVMNTQGTSLICNADAGVNDDGVRFAGTITTKPFQWAGLYQKFGVVAARLFAKAASSTIGLKLIRNLGLETKEVTVSIAPSGAETYVVKPIDDARMSECQFVQFTVGDPSTFAGSQLDQTWTLDELAFGLRSEEDAP